MCLAVVYGREIDGKESTFGTTGYTMNDTFVLYDRATDSVWYPSSKDALEATSGASRGFHLPFLDKPVPMPLADWVAQHPETTVLLPPTREALYSKSTP